jgi:hypothetical protein
VNQSISPLVKGLLRRLAFGGTSRNDKYPLFSVGLQSYFTKGGQIRNQQNQNKKETKPKFQRL